MDGFFRTESENHGPKAWIPQIKRLSVECRCPPCAPQGHRIPHFGLLAGVPTGGRAAKFHPSDCWRRLKRGEGRPDSTPRARDGPRHGLSAGAPRVVTPKTTQAPNHVTAPEMAFLQEPPLLTPPRQPKPAKPRASCLGGARDTVKGSTHARPAEAPTSAHTQAEADHRIVHGVDC